MKESDVNANIINALLQGSSISSVMVPDPALPSNQPAHDETYRFQHIFIDGDCCWVQTNTTHRGLRNCRNITPSSSFFYAMGYENQMITFAPDQKSAIVGSIPHRYASFSWRLRNEYDLVWHSDESDNVMAIRTAIKNGARFKVALKDEEGFWSIHPVDLINIDQDSSGFSIRTEITNVPAFLPEKGTLLALMKQVCEARGKPEQMVQIDIMAVAIYYACFSNGTYYTYFDEARTLFREYLEMRIFATHDRGNEVLAYPYVTE